jgi:hypothetical protein
VAVWRVGFAGSPCEFTPRHLCGWNHRFDDPSRGYRTIYAADKKETCLREVLADLRPDKKTIADFKKLFGEDDALDFAGRVPRAWRKKHALAQADVVTTSGAMAEIESASVLTGLSRRLSRELAARKLKRLDITRLRSQARGLTRAASRLLHDDGHCGIRFRSRLDKIYCHALFEGRAHLRPRGGAISLTGPVPELIAVCADYGLILVN